MDKDNLFIEDLSKSDKMYNFGIDVEIYTVNQNHKAKETIREELELLINNVFEEHYGMYRRINHQLPNADLDAYRWEMKYDCKIDERRIIYRR